MSNFSKILVVILIVLALIGSSGYFAYKNFSILKQQKIAVEAEKNLLTENFTKSQKKIDSLNQILASTTAERNDFEQKYNNEKDRVNALAIQFGAAKDTVGVLERVSSVDKELLKKYSKVSFLNENYVPKKLAIVDDKYVYTNGTNGGVKKELSFLEKVLPNLQKLMDDAYSAGVDIKIISAYRSFGEQEVLKYNYKMTYGSGANQFSADQGYSEHQLGTTLDFTTIKLDGTLTAATFEKSPTYAWLLDNAHKYGFILSYPKGNAYYQFEPWHWRFIGVDFATKLHDENKIFYELDQRLIDTYLISFFD